MESGRTKESLPKESFHEKNHYEDAAFPVGIYKVTKESIVPPGRGYMDLHWHEELQFTLVTEGVLKLQVNAEEYKVKAGEAIFINRNLLHITTELSEHGRYISLNFPDKMLGFFPGSRMEQDFVHPYTGNCAVPAIVLREGVEWQNGVLKLLRHIIAILEQKKQGEYEYLIAMKLTEMWYRLVFNIKFDIKRPSCSYIRKQERIHQMLIFIHNHYMEKIYLKDIAAVVNISEGECCRCFQGMLRMSPNQYLLNYRISKGMELLNSTEQSVTDVAYAVGFNDSNYFIQYFKKKTGMTPKEYRKK